MSDALFLCLTAENPVILPGIDKSKAYMSTTNTQYHDDEEEFMYTEVLSNYGDLLVSWDVVLLYLPSQIRFSDWRRTLTPRGE